MLIIVVISFEWSERHVKLYRYVRLQHCTLGKNLEDSHVLSI